MLILISLVSSILASSLSSHSSTNLTFVRVLLLLRALRFFDFLGKVRQFRLLFSTASRLLSMIASVIGVFLVMFYLFATIGMLIFGGSVTANNPKVMVTEYGTSGYYCYSFNDFINALVTLFHLMVRPSWETN